MKAKEVLQLRNELQFQLSYRPNEEDKIFLRDLAHFKIQYALRKNLDKLSKEANIILDSIKSFKSKEEREKAIEDAPNLKIELHKIKLDEIPIDAKVNASGMWVLEYFILTP